MVQVKRKARSMQGEYGNSSAIMSLGKARANVVMQAKKVINP